MSNDRRLRAPWACLDEARELLDSLALDPGETERALAVTLSLETAERVLVPALSPELAELLPRHSRRCPHAEQAGATVDLDYGFAACDRCITGKREEFALDPEVVERIEAEREPEGQRLPPGHDHCVLCNDGAELVPFRVLRAGRWFEGHACPACAGWLP